MRLVSGRLQVLCAALLVLSAARIATAASTGSAPVTSVRAALR